MSSTPCVNVTILDDNIPENELYITIGLSVDSMDVNAVFIEPGRNVTTIAILDDDHGMCKVHCFSWVTFGCINRPFPLSSTPDVTSLINVINPFR